MTTLSEQARITASMIALGERIAHGRDVDLLLQLAAIAEAQEDVITRLKYEVDAIPAIKAERDALAADAARYQFMKSRSRVLGATVDGNHAWACQITGRDIVGPTLDDALREAMRQAGVQ